MESMLNLCPLHGPGSHLFNPMGYYFNFAYSKNLYRINSHISK